jgi:hypothetical protein
MWTSMDSSLPRRWTSPLLARKFFSHYLTAECIATGVIDMVRRRFLKGASHQ